MAGSVNVQKAVEKTVMEAAKVLEDEIDAEIEKLDHMDADSLEKLRYALYSKSICHISTETDLCIVKICALMQQTHFNLLHISINNVMCKCVHCTSTIYYLTADLAVKKQRALLCLCPR